MLNVRGRYFLNFNNENAGARAKIFLMQAELLLGGEEAIDRYMGEQYGKLRKRRGRRSRVDSESYQAGRVKGGTIRINRTLPGSAG